MNPLTGTGRLLLENLVDDSFDLFEVVSIVGSEMQGTSVADHIAAAQHLVRSLMNDQLISPWILPSIGAEEIPLPPDLVPQMFASDAKWRLPVEDGPRIRVAATAKGRDTYYSGV